MNMRLQKTIKQAGALAIAFVLSGLLLAPMVSASGFDQIKTGMDSAAGAAGINQVNDLEKIVGGLIGAALSFIGVLLLVYILYGGFTWMTAGGNTKKVEEAQTMIKNAVIGIVIVVTAYAISKYVVDLLIGATGASQTGP